MIEDVAVYLSEARLIDLFKKSLPGKGEGSVDSGKRKYPKRNVFWVWGLNIWVAMIKGRGPPWE